MKQTEYRKGETIFREGETQSTMYEIVSGRVGIYARRGTPDERKLTELEAGKLFGEMGMVDHAPRSASAVSLEDGTVVREISAEEFGALIREAPDQVLAVMKGLSGRLRDLTENYRDVCGVIAQLESVSDAPPERKKGFLAALKHKIVRYAEEYDRCMKMAAATNDFYYWQNLTSIMY